MLIATVRRCRTLLVLAAISCAVSAEAANCDAIITHGLRNIQVSQSSDAATTRTYFNHCQKNFSSMSDQQLAEAEVEIFGQGRGDGSYSRQIRQDSLQQWCTTNQSLAARNQSSLQESQTFYAGAVDAWSKCNQLNTRGLRISPIISPDSQTVDMTIAWVGPTSPIILAGVPAQGFTCTALDSLGRPVKFPVSVGTASVNVRCLRASARTAVRDGQSYNVVDRGTIAVQTSAEPFQLFFAEAWDPGLPAREAAAIRELLAQRELPVGTIIRSVLEPAKFLSNANPQYKPGRWMQADGSLAPTGSAYVKISGSTTVPDLRAEQQGLSILDIASAPLPHGASVQQVAAASANGQKGSWYWFSSPRAITGNTPHPGDWEQDKDRFENRIESSGAIVAQGSTWNSKKNTWGPWLGGESQVFGISASRGVGYYYIKIE